MLPVRVVRWVRDYYALLQQEREISGAKREIARKLLGFFKDRQKKDPSFTEFQAEGLKCIYVTPVVDEFEVQGLYRALLGILTKEELQELFPRTVNRELLHRLIQSGRIDPAVVSEYYRPETKRPYIRVIPA